VIVVDNLPVVAADKYPKLLSVISGKIFGQFGTIVKDGVMMPMKDGSTCGYCFIRVSI
jgi:translation initiation factor 3 subunit B